MDLKNNLIQSINNKIELPCYKPVISIRNKKKNLHWISMWKKRWEKPLNKCFRSKLINIRRGVLFWNLFCPIWIRRMKNFLWKDKKYYILYITKIALSHYVHKGSINWMKETNIESIKTLLNPKETRRKVEPNLNTSNTKLNKA